MKKITLVLIMIMIGFSLVACNSNNEMSIDNGKKVAMVADTGTVNDNSFNQSAWEGLQELKKETGVAISYLNSMQTSDYRTNLEKLTDDGNNLVWGIGYAFADYILDVAKANPLCSYAIIDYTYGGKQPNNLTGIGFRSEEPAFLVGYAAGMTTTTNRVGFIGGMPSTVISQFEYGYKAGVEYAAKERGIKIEIVEQYAGSFSDAAIGRAIADKMYSVQNCDIIFHAASHLGDGVIEQARQSKKMVIGVDKDQSYLAPDNVLTSALKDVGKAVRITSKQMLDGENIGGKDYFFGLKENCVGIPTENKNLKPQIYENAMKLQDKIIAGDLVIPGNEKAYQEFKNEQGLSN